jgi:hypothetical protein
MGGTDKKRKARFLPPCCGCRLGRVDKDSDGEDDDDDGNDVAGGLGKRPPKQSNAPSSTGNAADDPDPLALLPYSMRFASPRTEMRFRSSRVGAVLLTTIVIFACTAAPGAFVNFLRCVCGACAGLGSCGTGAHV